MPSLLPHVDPPSWIRVDFDAPASPPPPLGITQMPATPDVVEVWKDVLMKLQAYRHTCLKR